MKKEIDFKYLRMAKLLSYYSKDPSTKTGAVLVVKGEAVGWGYNQFPHGMKDIYYENREEKYSRIVHCEINAMIKAASPIREATLYTWPFLSCERCCVQMLAAGVIRFVAPEPTEDQLSRWGTALNKTKNYCKELGREVTEYPMGDL